MADHFVSYTLHDEQRLTNDMITSLFSVWVAQVRGHLGDLPSRMIDEWLFRNLNRKKTAESVILIINCALLEVLQGPGTITVTPQLDPIAGDWMAAGIQQLHETTSQPRHLPALDDEAPTNSKRLWWRLPVGQRLIPQEAQERLVEIKEHVSRCMCAPCWTQGAFISPDEFGSWVAEQPCPVTAVECIAVLYCCIRRSVGSNP